MNCNTPITISSTELRKYVEEYIRHPISNHLWNRCESYARRKLDLCRERDPDANYYNNAYLVLLTADTIREATFADGINRTAAKIIANRERKEA